MDPRRPGSRLPLVFLVLGLGLGCAVAILWWLPKVRRDQILRNERSAEILLRTLATAAEEFRMKDRDGNAVHDYWTGDVAELHRYGLIQRAVAEADARPLSAVCPAPVPFNGYYVVAMELDEEASPPEPLRQDTDGKSGKVHHLTKFGYCLYPVEPGVTGHYFYIISAMGGRRRIVAQGPPPRNWPKDHRAWSQWD